MPSQENDLLHLAYVVDTIESLADSVEQHFDNVGRSLKDTFRDLPWLPDSMKPPPPPPPIRRTAPSSIGYLEVVREWISEHRAVMAAMIAFIGTGTFIIWRKRRSDRAKRRARRAKNGSRTDVVVLAGSAHSPLTRAISSDLERRGFIVYIPVGSLAEEQLVQSDSRSDIRPLNLDITSVRALFSKSFGLID